MPTDFLNYTTTGNELVKDDPGYLIKAKTETPILNRNPPLGGYQNGYEYGESATVLVSTGVFLALPEGWYAILQSPGTLHTGNRVNVVSSIITHRDTEEILITVKKDGRFDKINDGDVIGRLLIYKEPETWFVKKN